MLDKYRQEINRIDEELINLLEKRFTVTKAIGEFKKENNIPVLNKNREQEIVEKIQALDLDNEKFIIELYLQLMKIAKDQQNG